MLASLGYRVFAGVRSTKAGKVLQEEGSELIFPLILDITNSKQISRALETVIEILGFDTGLKGIVNNAGIGLGGPLEFISIDDLRQQLEVNLIGHVAMTQAFLPLIRKEIGRIINISSMNGRLATPFSGPYVASKFAMEGISDSLRRELDRWGIAVVIIQPGFVSTPILEKAISRSKMRSTEMPNQAVELYEKQLMSVEKFQRKLFQKAMPPESVAKVIVRALEAKRPKVRYIVGLDARIGYISTYLPDRLMDRLLNKIFERI